MYRIGSITFHPARNPRQFIANASVTFVDEVGEPFVTVHDFVLGRSQWDKDEHSQGKLYAAVPASFYKTYDRGQTRNEIVRSVEFPAETWRDISRRIVAEYQQQRQSEVRK